MASCTPSACAGSLAAAASEGQSSTPRTALGLLDLPAPWLDQLLTEVEPQQRLELFRCCRALRDLVLSQHTLAVDFWLPLGPETAPAAQARLMLACQRSSRIKLVLRGDMLVPSPSRTASAISISAGNLMFGAMAALGQGLYSIQIVEMSYAEMDALVPPWLTFTCPNMTSLHLLSCHSFGRPMPGVEVSNLPPPTAAIPTCSQLKELHLRNIPMSGTPAQWQHQFRALTGLNSLFVHGTSEIMQHSSCIGGQITQLTAYTATGAGELQHLPSWFPNLTQMHLPNAIIDDELMEGLLGMQHLTQLRCHGFHLQHSYRHRNCRWTTLGFSELHCPLFDRLPLGGVQLLRGVPALTGAFYMSPGDDLGAVNRAAAVIAACGGLKCDWERTSVHDSALIMSNDRQPRGVDGARPDHTCLMACLPLAASCQPPAFDLFGIDGVTLELLTAIKRHLPSTVQCMEFGQCTFEPGVLPALLPNLPPDVNQVKLTYMDPYSEAELTEVCVSATRSVTLVVESVDSDYQRKLAKGWEQRVQAAMAAAGHQHVTLDDGNPAMGTDSQGEDGSEDEGEGGHGGAAGNENDG